MTPSCPPCACRRCKSGWTMFRRAEEAIRVERHDLRHRLQTVAGLVEQGRGQEALDFIGAAQRRLDEVQPVQWCRPPVLDAVFLLLL